MKKQSCTLPFFLKKNKEKQEKEEDEKNPKIIEVVQ